MKKILKIFGYILIIGVIALYLPIALPSILSYQEYEVISGSMEPEYPVGSLVYVKAADFGEINEGDVIAFSSSGTVITHRVVEVDTQNLQFTTKGDANEANDFLPVSYSNTLGLVKFHIAGIGVLAAFLAETTGKLISIVLIIFGFIMLELAKKLESLSSNPQADNSDNAKKKKPSIIVPIAGILIIVCGLGGFYYIYNGYKTGTDLYAAANDNYTDLNDSDDASWQDMIDVDFNALSAVNPDIIGWIYVENTDISYPILYSGEDETYLHTAYDGTTLNAGSIFMEGLNSCDFSDLHTIIYGHNMRNLSMFGSLKFYKTEDGYLQDGHQYFQIITPESKHRYEIFSYFDTDPGSWVYNLPYNDSPVSDYEDYISSLISHSYEQIDTDVSSGDYIVTLSTCSSSERRFVVHGVLVE